MKDALTKLWISTQFKWKNFREDFKSEEKGAVEIITIVLIVVVVIALAVIFKDRLTTLLGNVFDKTDNAVDTLGQ
jgi:hypothetical protein